VTALQTALSLDGGEPEPYLALALYYRRVGSAHGAVHQLRRYTRLRPEDPRGWTLLGEAFFDLGEPGNAREAAARGLARHPDDPGLLAVAGEAARRSGDLAAAESAFSRLLRRNPASVPALLGLGRVHLARSFEPAERTESVRCLQLAAAGAPEDPDVLYELGQALVASGKAAEAIDVWRRAAALSPEDPAVYHALAQALHREGTSEEAAAYEERFLIQTRYRNEVQAFYRRCRMQADQAEAQFQLARIDLRYRHPERARAALRSGLALRPDDPWARRALAQVEAGR
jgi:predicted Zn-dependent protease